ncbi:MAG: phosphotransferase [Chloroflexi bacterium]|nr:phosphotransferase [Chloroflexota bacterium]
MKPRKQSYESSRDVQRWLKHQRALHPAADTMFEPTFLAGRRDSDWVLSALSVFHAQGLIADVVGQASSGKEATVYCCTGGPAADVAMLAAKVYRPRMFRSLKNDAIYRNTRLSLDEHGHPVNRVRGRLTASASERGREVRVASWIKLEYEVQERLFAAGADVPQPYAHTGNTIVMGFIGEDGIPAPRLCDVTLNRAVGARLFDRLIANVTLFLAHHVVHGDLSPYNVLFDGERVTVIDMAQAVDPRYGDAAYTLLERDIARLCTFFARYGMRADGVAITADLWSRYLTGDLPATLQEVV